MAAGVRSTVVERRAGAAVFRVFSRSLRGLSALERVEVIVEGFGINKHHGKDIWGGKKAQLASRRCAILPQDGSKCSKHNK